jgi:very-short-patch-repair endonuclease
MWATRYYGLQGKDMCPELQELVGLLRQRALDAMGGPALGKLLQLPCSELICLQQVFRLLPGDDSVVVAFDGSSKGEFARISTRLEEELKLRQARGEPPLSTTSGRFQSRAEEKAHQLLIDAVSSYSGVELRHNIHYRNYLECDLFLGSRATQRLLNVEVDGVTHKRWGVFDRLRDRRLAVDGVEVVRIKTDTLGRMSAAEGQKWAKGIVDKLRAPPK